METLNTLGLRIRSARKDKKWSQARLAEECGWDSASRVGNYEQDTREPVLEDIRLMAEKLGVREAWLSSGDEPKHPTAEALSVSLGSNIEPGPPVRGKVPLISQVSAGEWCEASDPFPPGVADDWIETTARVGSRAFALRVRGDSMTNPTGFPSFPDGVIVIVDPDCHPVHGSYVIAKIGLGGDAMFKRLSYDDGAVYLLPLNPKFDPVKVDDPRELHICGVVVKGEFDVMNGVSR